MDKIYEEIEWLSEMGYSHYRCMQTMEAMLEVVEAAKNVYSYSVVDPIACTVSKNRMLDLQNSLAKLEESNRET